MCCDVKWVWWWFFYVTVFYSLWFFMVFERVPTYVQTSASQLGVPKRVRPNECVPTYPTSASRMSYLLRCSFGGVISWGIYIYIYIYIYRVVWGVFIVVVAAATCCCSGWGWTEMWCVIGGGCVVKIYFLFLLCVVERRVRNFLCFMFFIFYVLWCEVSVMMIFLCYCFL